MNGDTTLPLKAWKNEVTKLTAEKADLYKKYHELKAEVHEVEKIKKATEHIEKEYGRNVKIKPTHENEL